MQYLISPDADPDPQPFIGPMDIDPELEHPPDQLHPISDSDSNSDLDHFLIGPDDTPKPKMALRS